MTPEIMRQYLAAHAPELESPQVTTMIASSPTRNVSVLAT